ncbi:Hypothetical predicted protein [Mytilus galloprovincialis]|uniref:Transposase domain-containing protein n=1 Tax=Mytilus galloprovincialis TaxID=29158 RepID=A0A8B6CB63_MYTGA|nr:Hypothetical predicted protein [Mytilus galloprovincialis]
MHASESKERRKRYKKAWMHGARSVQRKRCREIGSSDSEDENQYSNMHVNTGENSSISSSKSNYESNIHVHEDQGILSDGEMVACENDSISDSNQVSQSESELWNAIDQHIVISSDSEDNSEIPNQELLSKLLPSWVNENNISHNSTDKLLKMLKFIGLKQLPATARSLLKTKRHVDTKKVSGMDYFYFGIEEGIVDNLKKYPEKLQENVQQIDICFNIDGLPLFKSSRTSLWPILCGLSLEKYPVAVFPVALCLGQSKPKDLNFMNDAIEELQRLNGNGFQFKERTIQIKICSFICDAPAKAMIKNVKLYSGYYGCDKCTQTGVWNGRITYQEIDTAQPRTDISFRSQSQPEHHHGNTPLTNLPIDMTKAFPVDYMHQTCLGVMKRLLLLWLRGKRDFKLSAQNKDQISFKLLQLRKAIPSVFARKPRSLDDVDRWKATEYRQFLLYTGKIVLKDILRPELYSHFMTLSVGIGIIVSPELSKNHQMYAENLLKFFIAQGREIYGPEFLVYNVHSMMHIADDVKNLGHLDKFSAFPYENYMQKLKKAVHSGKCPLIQIIKRIFEMKNET